MFPSNSFDCLLFLYACLHKHMFSCSNRSRAVATKPVCRSSHAFFKCSSSILRHAFLPLDTTGSVGEEWGVRDHAVKPCSSGINSRSPLHYFPILYMVKYREIIRVYNNYINCCCYYYYYGYLCCHILF